MAATITAFSNACSLTLASALDFEAAKNLSPGFRRKCDANRRTIGPYDVAIGSVSEFFPVQANALWQRNWPTQFNFGAVFVDLVDGAVERVATVDLQLRLGERCAPSKDRLTEMRTNIGHGTLTGWTSYGQVRKERTTSRRAAAVSLARCEHA
jgi:hypothetical protein